MPAVYSGNTTPCNDFDTNAAELDNAIKNTEIVQNGQLLLTRVDNSTTTNTIPHFPNFVITGLNLTVDGTDIDYTAGDYQIDAVVYSIAVGGSLAVPAPDATDNRIDIVTVTTSNTIVYTQGTASANPVAPSVPSGHLLVGVVGVTSVANGSIITLTAVNLSSATSAPVLPTGTESGQLLQWDDAIGQWTLVGLATMRRFDDNNPTIGIGYSTNQTNLDDYVLAVNGNIKVDDGYITIDDITAPTPTTNNLYAVGGDLFWDGTQLNSATIATGTVDNSLLNWDGASSSWVENTSLIQLDGGIGNSGFNSGSPSISGGGNTVLGSQALGSITSGGANTAMGLGTLGLLTTGSRNTAIGPDNLRGLTTQSDNTAVGYECLEEGQHTLTTGLGANLTISSTSSNTNIIGANTTIDNATNSNILSFQLRSNDVDNSVVAGNRTVDNTNVDITNSILVGNRLRNTSSNISDTMVLWAGDDSVKNNQYSLSNNTIYVNTGDYVDTLTIGNTTSNDTTLRIEPRSGLNSAGGSLTISSQATTGNVDGGSINLDVSIAGASGSAVNAPSTQFRINPNNSEFVSGKIESYAQESVDFTTVANVINYYVDTSSTAITATLDNLSDGQVIVIKDEALNAATNNITISPASGTIDGTSTYVIISDGGSAKIQKIGVNYFVI